MDVCVELHAHRINKDAKHLAATLPSSIHTNAVLGSTKQAHYTSASMDKHKTEKAALRR
jgi:hypothetical protein